MRRYRASSPYIRVPNLELAALLGNGSVTELTVLAQFSVNLRLVELLDGNPTQRETIETVVVFQSVHKGNRGCIFLAFDPVSYAIGAANCIAGTFQRHAHRATPSLQTVVQAGKTYALELEVAGRVTKTATASQNGGNVTSNFLRELGEQDMPALKWTQMVVTIGTDPQSVVAPHLHGYRTGRGRGHNNRDAETSPPLTE